MEHNQSSYFCRGPDEFCWGSAPVGPTLVTGPVKSTHWQSAPAAADRNATAVYIRTLQNSGTLRRFRNELAKGDALSTRSTNSARNALPR